MLMRFFLSIWCWVILSELRRTEFCKNYIVFKLLLKLFVSEMRCHSCTAGGRRRSLLSWGQCCEGEGYRFRWRLEFFWRGHGFKKGDHFSQGISYDSIFWTIFILLCRRKSFSAELSVENERILWAMKRWEIENLMAVAAFCCILFEN